MKQFKKGFVFGSVVGGSVTLLFMFKNKQKQDNKWKSELKETSSLLTTWQKEKKQVIKEKEKVSHCIQTTLPTFLKEMNDLIEDYSFQLQPRITQIKKQFHLLKHDLPFK